MSRSHRGGFTLIEVLVALVITSTLALLAHQLFAAAVDGSRRLELARRRLDRESNARDFLRDAFLSLDVGLDAGPFEGEPHRLRFSAWLPVPDGWNERRAILLAGDSGRLTATTGDGAEAPLVLAEDVRSVSLDYLITPGADAHWVMDWHSAVSAPLAVRVRITRPGGDCDTTLYLVKARG